MDILEIENFSLKNLEKINILMGKNGCGKSTILRLLDKKLNTNDEYGHVKYISPERGGYLNYNPGIEQQIFESANLRNDRSNNQVGNFKLQTVAQYRNLETLNLRKYQKDNSQPKFEVIITKINKLLDNLKIKSEGTTFKIYTNDDIEISPNLISSGESELISLAIEALVFEQEKIEKKSNFLLLDEPDVHLHPDLQVKLMHFLYDLVNADGNLKIIIATHSTAILGAFEEYKKIHVCFMSSHQKEIIFENVSDVYRKILPIFGAHPLSNIFNLNPILIVEGEDDVRIWQQVIRSAEGKVKLYPCSAGSIDEISEMERDAKKIIQAIYDKARGYSLRDRDDKEESIDDDIPIIRFRLSCTNAENLILSDECLITIGTNWEQMKTNIANWIESEKAKSKKHKHFDILRKFKDEHYQRKTFDLKEIRNDLMHIAGSNKPWEVAVGQTIANNLVDLKNLIKKEGSMANFLGEKTVKELFTEK
jgi:predicted ATPase